MYTLFFVISITILLTALGLTIINSLNSNNKVRFFKPFYTMTAGVFLAITTMFLPINAPLFAEHGVGPLATLFSSLHTAIRFFIVDCDFELITTGIQDMSPLLQQCYLTLSSCLYIVAPLLTASIVLSFFENISAYNRYVFAYFRDTYIFSELNERSISLASSLKAADKKRLIIFTDVFDNDTESSYELLEKAKKLDAILFKKDITTINFKRHSTKTKLHFMIIGDDEFENFNQTVALVGKESPDEDTSFKIIRHYSYDYPRSDTRIYVFSTKGSIEQYLSALQPKYLKLRRINDVQSLIYKILYDDGMQIFDSAQETGETVYNSATGTYDPERKISAVVIGMGAYGTEMVRSLAWFAQMHPYKLEINAFDKDPLCDSKFHSLYPDLFDVNPAKVTLPEPEKDENGNYTVYPYRNGDYTTPGEAHYKISIHTDVNCDCFEFDHQLSLISDATYIFVSLGDDNANIRVATKARILMRRVGKNPVIHTVVHNPQKQDSLVNGKTVYGQSYNIVPYGDIHSTYSSACVLNSDLEDKALGRHLAYINQVVEFEGLVGEEREKKIAKEEESFWKYDYNYRSSTASVIHRKFKIECKIPGIDKAPQNRSEAENNFFREMEHKRWNAYVRSEGFVYAKVRDKLAKTHNLLVPFEDLPYEEKIKDDN